MAVLENLKTRVKECMRSGEVLERDLLRTVIGAVGQLQMSKTQGSREVTDEQIYKIMREIVESNNQTMAQMVTSGRMTEGGYTKLQIENRILEPIIPSVLDHDQTFLQLQPDRAAILEAKSEGQAVGVAMGILKKRSLSVDGNVVKTVVQGIRAS